MTVLCEDNIYWYALRVTYGREKKAYDYLVSRNVEAYYPTLETVKVIDGINEWLDRHGVADVHDIIGCV